MKKKLLAVLLVIFVLAFGMQTEAYASEDSLMYEGISSITSYMGIDGCILEYSIDVITRGNEYADAVHIDAELRTIDGRLIKTYNEDLIEEYNTLFCFEKRRAVSESGTYFLHFTVSCYKDGVRIDKITKDSKTVTYTR